MSLIPKRWSVVEYDRHTGRQTGGDSPRFWTSWGAWAERQELMDRYGHHFIYEVSHRDRIPDRPRRVVQKMREDGTGQDV